MRPQKTFLTYFSPLLLGIILLLSACSAPITTLLDAEPTAANNAVTTTTTEVDTEVDTAADPITVTTVVDTNQVVAGDLEGIYDRVNPSVVHIRVTQPGVAMTNSPFALPNQIPQQGEGSGFVWDTAGHIVTNNHVIAGAEEITVYFSDDTAVDATVVGTDPDTDLAVLQVDLPAEKLQPVQLGDYFALNVGQQAIAIGNPFGQEGTMTVGIISALGRLMPVETMDPTAPRYSIPDVIQTDAAINPGNSGGVLLDENGAVIGVTSAIISSVRSSAGIGFAIPSYIVEKVVPALISVGNYQHPSIGITGTTLTPELATAMDLSAEQRGALVIEVVPDGPAAQADLQASIQSIEIDGAPAFVGGDVIVAADGRPIHDMDDLITDLSRHGVVGEAYTVTVLRDGTTEDVTLTLQPRPERTTQPATEAADRGWLGITATSVTPEIAAEMNLSADQTGVMIVDVQPDSPAAKAGLQGSTEEITVAGRTLSIGGDVITAVDGQPITSLADLQTIMAQTKANDVLTLTIIRDGQELLLDVTLG